MHLGNRFHLVRGMRTADGAYTPPMILDRGRAQDSYHLYPYAESEEWWRNPAGRWRALWRMGQALRHFWDDERGAVGYNGATGSYPPFIGFPHGDITINPQLDNFSSAYVVNSTGWCHGVMMQNAQAKTLNHIYGYYPSYGGTPSSVTSLNYEVRSKKSGAVLPDPAGGALLASGSFNPSSNTGWMRNNSSAIGLSVPLMSLYWIILADADGNGTNFIRNSVGGNSTYQQSVANNFTTWPGFWNSSGFSSASGTVHYANIIAVWSDGTATGDPFTAQANAANDTNQKGLYVAGFQTQKSVWAMSGAITSTAVDTGRIWEGSAGPTGSGYKDQGTTALYYLGNVSGIACSTTVTLSALTAYRFVLKNATNAVCVVRRQIGTVVTGVNSGAASDMSAAMPGGGGWFYTAENSGSWTDTTTEIPEMTVWVVDDVAAPSGGASLSRVFTGQ